MDTLPTRPSGSKPPDGDTAARRDRLPFIETIDLHVDELTDPRLGTVMDVGPLLALGFSVLPVCRDSKKPACEWKVWQDRHPTNDELGAWLTDGCVYNVGIVTGAISNLVVVDLDNDRAIDWAETHLPQTRMKVRTGGGGLHLYYRHPGEQVRNRVRIDTGDPTLEIDIRADGGYVIAPGSVHHETGRRYEHIDAWPATVDALPVFDPAWLAEPTSPEAPPRVDAAIRHGERNATLTSFAGTMRRRGMGRDAIRAALHHENNRCDPPLAAAEVDTIAESVSRYAPEAEAPPEPLRFRTARELCQSGPERLDHVVEPFLVAGCITELHAPPKLGKTTFVNHVVACAAGGVSCLDYPPTAPTKVVVITEEPGAVLREGYEAAGLAARGRRTDS